MGEEEIARTRRGGAARIGSRAGGDRDRNDREAFVEGRVRGEGGGEIGGGAVEVDGGKAVEGILLVGRGSALASIVPGAAGVGPGRDGLAVSQGAGKVGGFEPEQAVGELRGSGAGIGGGEGGRGGAGGPP